MNRLNKGKSQKADTGYYVFCGIDGFAQRSMLPKAVDGPLRTELDSISRAFDELVLLYHS